MCGGTRQDSAAINQDPGEGPIIAVTSIDIFRFPAEANGLLAALDYARRGFKSFQLYNPVAPHRVGFGCDETVRCSCGRPDCKTPGKHPRTIHGCRDATCDPAIIRAWFARWPNANIAIATGDGLLVIDIDPRNGGGETLAKLEAEHGPFPREAAVVSGGGGIHLYYRYPKNLVIKSLGDALGPGVDLKADGGYVAAPPSLHKSGNRYRWLRKMPPAKLPAAPKWLLELAVSGAARNARRGFESDRPVIKTADHPDGQALAKVLGARDRGTYWSFDCPARAHKTPDAAMYPWPNGQVNLVCYSSSPCSFDDIMAAIRERLR